MITEPVNGLVHRPTVVSGEMLMFLDDIREEGRINMFAARRPLMTAFNLSDDDARVVLQYWMESFDERHLDEE